jgi:hypothetical protein
VAALTIGGVTPAGTTLLKPTVRIVELQPLYVRGSGFRALEHIRVTAKAKTVQTRTVRAKADGSFAAELPAVALPSCGGGVLVTARGQDGQVAWAARKLRSECPRGGDDGK